MVATIRRLVFRKEMIGFSMAYELVSSNTLDDLGEKA
jgi:hypothetical protein